MKDKIIIGNHIYGEMNKKPSIMIRPCKTCTYKNKECDGGDKGAANNYLYGCGPYGRYLGYMQAKRDMRKKK